MRLFGYALDLCVCNAWILYNRDCKALGDKHMPLKQFYLDASCFARCQKFMVNRVTRLTPEGTVSPPKPGQRSVAPSDHLCYDRSKLHKPVFVSTRQTCKHCFKKVDIHRSRWICEVCQVALCLSDTRNCFKVYHNPANESPLPTTQSLSISAQSP